MPLYDYECKNCGHELEVEQAITAKPLARCPKCLKLTLKRVIKGPRNIQFKGKGFYCKEKKN